MLRLEMRCSRLPALLAAALLAAGRLAAADAVRVTAEGETRSGIGPVLSAPVSLGGVSGLSGGLAAPSLTGALNPIVAPTVAPKAVLAAPAVPRLTAPRVEPDAAASPASPLGAIQQNTAEIQKILTDPAASPAAEERSAAASAELFVGKLHGAAADPASMEAVSAAPDSQGPVLRRTLAKAQAQPVPIAQLVEGAIGRRFPSVAIQQEQEGNLTARDPRDSGGNVFTYYRPVEMRPELVNQVQAGLGRFDKLASAARRWTKLWRPASPWNAWEDWPLQAKLHYVSLLDAAVTRERGRDEVWDGPMFRLLERSPRAPPYVAKHPHLEEPRLFRGQQAFARYLEPEIVTDREHPAATVREAVSRTQAIIADTGHAGTHYHVFLRVEPDLLRRQMESLESTLQLINDVLFAEAASKSYDNLFHPFLLPWHKGRSERVRRLVAAGSPEPSRPDLRDPDNEKFAFVAFRYWGMEEGRLVVSFELRGAKLPWKSQRRSGMGQDMDMPKPERDYSEIERYLSFLVLYADRLSRGQAEDSPGPAPRLDLAAAERAISQRARQRGLKPEDYLDLADFSRSMFSNSFTQPQAAEDRAGGVHPALLLPYAMGAPDLKARQERLMDTFIEESARLKALSRGGVVPDGQLRNVKYMFWEAYADWARGLLAVEQARFDELFRSLGR